MSRSTANLRRFLRKSTPARWRRRLDAALRAHRTRRLVRHRQRPDGPGGRVLLLGFLSEGFGIGRAGRYTYDGLVAGHVPVTAIDIRPLIDGSAVVSPFDANPKAGTVLIHANPPEAMAALSRLVPGSLDEQYLIGYWAYELERVPETWLRAALLFDEIWVPSQFVADSLDGVGVPVHVRPHPVPAAQVAKAASPFTVGIAGDLASSATRKNLVGGLDVYLRAFPEPNEDTRLLVKTRPAAGHSDALTDLLARASVRPDIEVVTDTLEDQDIDALWAALGVFLSVHRAEGYGLVLAECLARGTPVLATGWSGNLEFMGSCPDLLLPYGLVPVSDPDGIYPQGGLRWAEPDIGAAAIALRRLRADPLPARRSAMVARDHLAAQRTRWIAGSARLTAGHTDRS